MSLNASVGAEAVRHELETLERPLAQHCESGPAQMSRAALDGTDQKLRACLASNELWGGPEAGVADGPRAFVYQQANGAIETSGLGRPEAKALLNVLPCSAHLLEEFADALLKRIDFIELGDLFGRSPDRVGNLLDVVRIDRA